MRVDCGPAGLSRPVRCYSSIELHGVQMYALFVCSFRLREIAGSLIDEVVVDRWMVATRLVSREPGCEALRRSA